MVGPLGLPTGDRPADCGAGGRHLALLRSVVRVAVYPVKTAQPMFTGASDALAPCRALAARGLALPLLLSTPALARDTADLPSGQGIALRPVMVIVDPARDPLGTMAQAPAVRAAEFVGLTGTKAALQAVYRVFAVEKTVVSRSRGLASTPVGTCFPCRTGRANSWR